MSFWRKLNDLGRLRRWPLKLALFALVTGLVLYPKVWLVPRLLHRLADMNAMLDPRHTELAGLERQVRDALPATPAPAETLKTVERVVCERIPYAWDWQTWGVFEYIPTVAEVFQKGREDCDGRAVVAASLLRRMGYDAWLVSDLLHVWVATPYGETMSPTAAETTLVATETGTRATVSLHLLSNLGRGLAYGVSAFPLSRELIILAALCLLAMQPRTSGWRRLAGCLLLWIALDLLRGGGRQAAIAGDMRSVATVWVGVSIAIAGWLVLAVRAGRRRAHSAAAHPG